MGFGENRIGSLIKEHPEKRAEIEKMQGEMSYYMLATFADVFGASAESMDEGRKRPQAHGVEPTPWHGADLAHGSAEEMEAVLADTVLGEFKTRLGRIGLEYQSPKVPA